MSAGDFLAANVWRLLEEIDLGTTARVFVVERDGQQQGLLAAEVGL
ncbi:MAG: hypothetical protein JXA14_24260 [Anaerolineae bacterium]|nr:hypothetical protein [Anaerolineae bacterium]